VVKAWNLFPVLLCLTLLATPRVAQAGQIATPAQLGSTTNDAIEKRLSAVEAKVQKPPKDTWDKISAVSGITSGLLVAIFGWWATNAYTRRQKAVESRRSNLQTIEKFLPYLSSEDPGIRRTSLVAISSLGDEELAVRFATSLGGPGSVAALMEIAAGSGTGAETATDELLRMFDGLMARVAKIRVNDDGGLATGFLLDGGHLLGTSDAVRESVRNMRKRNSGVPVDFWVYFSVMWSPARPARELAEDIHFRGDVLTLLMYDPARASTEIGLSQAGPRFGDRVVILTRDVEGVPMLRIGKATPTGILAEVAADASGSPVFNESGLLLGLLSTPMEGEGSHLIPYEDLIAFADGGGTLVRRVRNPPKN
jgi:hypothetical protein